jgi:hypothetical protein
VDLAATPSSQVTVAYDCRLLDGSDVAIPTLEHLDVTLVPTTSQTVEPELVDRAGDITSILVLGYRTGLAAHEADARTLLDLLLLRRHLDGRSGRPPRLVVELVDGANRDLAMTLGADGCVVRDILASRMIAQLAEQPERRAVLLHLYGSGGQSVHLVPATELGLTGAMTFAEVVAVAYSMGMLAIGWRLVDGGAAGSVRLNPRDSDRAELGPDDEIVLIAGDRAAGP